MDLQEFDFEGRYENIILDIDNCVLDSREWEKYIPTENTREGWNNYHDHYYLTTPNPEMIDFIEDLYQDGIAPEDWDEIDIENHLSYLDWFKEEYNKLVNEFNRRQKTECWQSNGIYVYPEYFKAELYGNDPEIARVEDGRYYGQEEIAEVIDRINKRTMNQFKDEIKDNFLNDTGSLTKEQKERVKESVKEYFKQHPELEIPKNEESGLPFWEDDFMETFSED